MPEHSLCVVLGAGASFDCCEDAGPWKNGGRWKPPILRDFFSRELDQVLENHQEARALLSVVRTRGAERFEEVLLELSDNPTPIIQRQLKFLSVALAYYFRNVSRDYTSEPINYSVLVNETLGRGIQTAFLTFNYDTLLDQSLSATTGTLFDSIDAYISAPDWLYLKAHGSIGWGYSWPEAGNRTLLGAVADVELPERRPESIDVGLSDVYQKNGMQYYPALALPLPGKTDFICPPAHLLALERFLTTCENFLFIGFRGNDPHLIPVVDAHVSSVRRLRIVSQGDATDIYERLRSSRAFRETPFVPNSHAFNGGFSDFVRRDLRVLTDQILAD